MNRSTQRVLRRMQRSSASRDYSLHEYNSYESSSLRVKQRSALNANIIPSTITHHHNYHTTPHAHSDNLLGHNPMARPAPNAPPVVTPKPISPFGVDSNNSGGGIWEQTSSKKTKLAELLSELTERGVDTGTKGMETLSDVAVGEERLDLELVGGLSCLVRIVDGGRDHDYGSGSMECGSGEVVNTEIGSDAKEAIRQLFKLFDGVDDTEEEWTKEKLESKMNEAIRILTEGSLPNAMDEKAKKKNVIAGSLDVSHPFCYLRQFVVNEEVGANVSNVDDDKNKDLDPEIQEQINTLNNITQQALASSTTLYRILLLRSTAQTILDNWDRLTTITSGDVDRAAVSKIELPPSSQRSTVNAKCVQEVFEAYAHHTPQEWVQSWWKLIDADKDGLIDQEEMNTCVDLTLEPVHLALGEVFDLSLQVCPVRTIGMGGEEEAQKKNAWFLGVESEGMDIPTTMSAAKLSWRNRRKELKEQKILRKAFRGTIERHFRDQAEAPHRLRCIYAWAEKEHQGNKLDSVLVDASEEWGSGAASAVMGRKRYVELEPKISYAEFREVQKKTFPHLDRIGEEIVTSFKEDLWLLQGTKRQNKELKKDGLLFLLGISIVDLGISMV